jgi:hypothetical protein
MQAKRDIAFHVRCYVTFAVTKVDTTVGYVTRNLPNSNISKIYDAKIYEISYLSEIYDTEHNLRKIFKEL